MAADRADELQRKQKRWAGLELERASWYGHWQELSRFLLPRSGRFLRERANSGEKKHNNIYDSTGTRALRVLAAGLMAGMTSPARPWFRLKTPDKDLNEVEGVKLWLADVTTRMRDVFNHSNTYRALHSIYEELGAFGTSSCFILEDYEHVIHCSPLTIGEYAIALDDKGAVSTLYRQFDMTVDQLVQKFGIENVSGQVRDRYNDNRGDLWIPVMHIVQPRVGGYDKSLPGVKNMPIESCYFETQNNEGKYLREAGFKRMPAVNPRWKVTSSDIYGESPGMEALGDVKQLQHEQLRKGQAIDVMVQPPLQAPTSMRGQPIQAGPGGFTFGDSAGPNSGVRTLFDMKIDMSHLLEDIQDVRGRINETFYVPLFLMLANEERSEITAREIAERHEEKLLMLGPVLERLHNELLAPLIDITFDRMLEAGIVPPPPPELQGVDLKVEFVSMLAQAQQAVGLSGIDRLIGTIGSAAAMGFSSMIDKLDGDAIVDAYAEMLGTDPSLILGDDKVAIIRQQKAAQQQALMQAEAAPAAAQTAKTLGETNTEGVQDVMNMFSGYSSPRP